MQSKEFALQNSELMARQMGCASSRALDVFALEMQLSPAHRRHGDSFSKIYERAWRPVTEMPSTRSDVSETRVVLHHLVSLSAGTQALSDFTLNSLQFLSIRDDLLGNL